MGVEKVAKKLISIYTIILFSILGFFLLLFLAFIGLIKYVFWIAAAIVIWVVYKKIKK